jgi:suppressor of ftsI
MARLNPVVQIRPGEMQFWRIANIGATLFIKFQIEGMPLYVVATDGHPRSQPGKTTEFFLGPGQRIDTIAIGPPAGEYIMRTISFKNEAWKKPAPPQQLAVIVSDGSGSAELDAETEVLAQRIVGPRWIDEVQSAPRSPTNSNLFDHARSTCLHDQRTRGGREPHRPDRKTR